MRRKEVMFVDGYNMIGAWPELAHLQRKDEIEAARDLLLFELSNYRKFRDLDMIVVFDAQYVPGITQSYQEYDLLVVFTQEGETADAYIERRVKAYLNPITRVMVATSDAAEQWMIFQQGALRISAQELKMDLDYAKEEIQSHVRDHHHARSIRKSPWHYQQIQLLDQLRREIEDQSE